MTAPDPLDLTGRVALVTGGTRGIGAAIAETYLTAGAQVLVCGRTEPDSLPVTAAGRPASFIAADVREPADAARAVDTAVTRFGRLDVLVNNAGGSPAADSATMSPRFVERVIALNLLAPFYAAQAANRVMQRQDTGGSIVNIGSVSAQHSAPGTAAYAAAKAGLARFTRALALEWGPKVRLNTVTPGLVRTDAALPFYGGERGIAAVSATLALRRLAEPSDIADACLFLGSGLSAYVTGADLAVHGGGEFPARHLAADRSSADRSADGGRT